MGMTVTPPFPSSWTSYTPTVSAASGTFGAAPVAVGRYMRIGKTVHVAIEIPIVDNGTADAYVVASLPFAAASVASNFSQVLVGRESEATGTLLHGEIANGDDEVFINTYSGAYPGAAGRTVCINGTYQAA